MNLLHIRYFYDAVRLNSVSGAAKANHVTQSAVSQGIMKLEQTLGVRLLTHSRNRIKVTEHGEKVFRASQKVIRSVSELQKMSFEEGGHSGELVFACSHSLAESIVGRALIAMKREAPNVRARVRLGHTGMIKPWLKSGHVEFGLVLDNDDLSDLDTELIHQGVFQIYRHRDRLKTVPTECLFAEPRAEIFAIKRAFLNRYKMELSTQMEINSWSQIANLAAQDFGFAFIPDYIVFHPRYRGILVPCELDIEPLRYQVKLAYPKGELLSRNGRLFLTILQSLAADQKKRSER